MATSHFPHREGSWSMTMTISLSFDHDHNLSLHAKEQLYNGEGRDGYGHRLCRPRIEKGEAMALIIPLVRLWPQCLLRASEE